jgi:hypothetical protein
LLETALAQETEERFSYEVLVVDSIGSGRIHFRRPQESALFI